MFYLQEMSSHHLLFKVEAVSESFTSSHLSIVPPTGGVKTSRTVQDSELVKVSMHWYCTKEFAAMPGKVSLLSKQGTYRVALVVSGLQHDLQGGHLPPLPQLLACL